ncbi:MAG: GNAT family N-acetyltransferase [Pseudomonadota bacterium]
MTLRTERLVLRQPSAAHTQAVVAFFGSERARFVGGPMDTGKAWRAFASFAGHWTLRGFGSFVAETASDARPVALVGPWFPGDWPEREIGWSLLAAQDEGQGYATEAARACLAHAFGPLGWDTAVSYIHKDNHASCAVAERLGARLEPKTAAPGADDLVYRHTAPGVQP